MEIRPEMIPIGIIVWAATGLSAYTLGFSHGVKEWLNQGGGLEEREDKWTLFIVLGIIVVVILISLLISMDYWEKESTTRLLLGILTVIVLSGAMGGIIGNYYRRHNVPDAKNANLLVSVLLGIGASFLVPVLLHILTSSLLTDIREFPEKAFLLAGFCESMQNRGRKSKKRTWF